MFMRMGMGWMGCEVSKAWALAREDRAVINMEDMWAGH